MIGKTNVKSNVEPFDPASVVTSWGGGAEEEITKMLDAHYKGLINVADYWAIGDSRTERIAAIPNGTTTDNQPAQNVNLVIIGMNHDDKADGSGKAAITVQTKDQLSAYGYINISYGSVDYSLWSTSIRRTWCNNNFKSALSTWLQNLIKPVTKVTNRHGYSGTFGDYGSYRGQISTTDDVFLLSEFESLGKALLGGTEWGDVGSDGTQYEYMKTQANRIKSGPTDYWWLRSAIVENDRSYFVAIKSDGNAFRDFADSRYGVAPAFCL
jgi:hypothetical protein